MSVLRKPDQEPSARNPIPIELRMLARLELKKRRLLHELAEIFEQYQELARNRA